MDKTVLPVSSPPRLFNDILHALVQIASWIEETAVEIVVAALQVRVAIGLSDHERREAKTHYDHNNSNDRVFSSLFIILL